MMGRFGSEERIAQSLTSAGWKVSERTVRRVRNEKPRPAPVPPHGLEPHRITHPVIARFVNHTWMMDVTEIHAFLGGGTLYLATVFDAFSRVPLAIQGYRGKPGASAMAKLLKTALRAFGKAKYVITDQGKEFSGKVFQKTAVRLGIHPRFGTKDRLFATARLERFWRTLKELTNVKADPPLNLTDLEARVELALAYYLCFRPHQGLAGATPAEAFLGVDPACTKSVRPPRARAGEGPREPPFELGFLDPEKRAFPILKAA